MPTTEFDKRLSFIKILVVMLLLLSITTLSAWTAKAQPGNDPEIVDPMPQKGSNLADRFEDQQTIRVIVQLQVPEQNQVAELMTPSIHTAQRDVLNTIKFGQVNLIHQYDYIPFMVVEVDQAGLEALQKNPLVVGIEEDMLMKPMLLQSVPLINADDAWAEDITGAGQVVAILDTGVDKNHPALAGKVVSEACYSTTSISDGSTSLCPDGASESTDINSALPYSTICPSGECDHGTHVAGIVAADGIYLGSPIKGVAPDTQIIAIQVFSKVEDSLFCGSSAPCVGSYTSDQLMGLQRVYDLRESFSIAAINLSLGGKSYTNQTTCDTENSSYKAKVDLLKSVGIATIAASGNNGYSNAISSPACISSVVSVGATTKSDLVASYSNSDDFLDLLAPGSSITSTIPGTGYETWNGTSMAAPHVAGAWALIKSEYSETTVDEVLQVLKNTGKLIVDTRNSLQFPRIDVYAAHQVLLNPPPEIPNNVMASDGDYIDKVEISWNYAEHATYYQIYRNSVNTTSTSTLIKDDQITSPFNDTSAIPGMIYFYWVKGCNLIGCSDFSLSDQGYIATGELIPPLGVDASDGLFNDKIQISWNGVGGANYYQVFRGEVNNPNGSSIIADSINGWTYDDLSGEIGIEYYYWIKACKTQGNICSDFSDYDVGYLKENYGIFLPLIMKNGVASLDPILNGNFENGPDSSWTEYSSNGYDLILSQSSLLVPPHNGSWAVWLGGDDYETSRLSQSIRVSSSSPYLHYWYWIGSEDYCGYDYFRLKINSSVVVQSDLCTLTSTNGWVERVVNLSNYSVSLVTLVFEVTTDSVWNSNFFLDDVSMSNVSTTSSAVNQDQQLLIDLTSRKVK